MTKEHVKYLEDYRNKLTLRHDQSWQIDNLVRQEIRRLEKVINKREADGKTANQTFENTLAFNKRLLTTINHQFYQGKS